MATNRRNGAAPSLRSSNGSGLRPDMAPALPADAVELLRLARTVLQKSQDDLTALADNDAHRYADWITQFTEHRARAEAELQFFSAAIAYLMTTAPSAAANDG
jgi:hypothetical protein